MSVYIANFGRGNYMWPTCKQRNTVATMIHGGSHKFYVAKDRRGFIDWCVANRKTVRGIVPTPAVASRWYGAMETIETTEGDYWIHKANDELWWTKSLSTTPEWSVEPAFDHTHSVYVCHKKCDRWSNENLKGARLKWSGLHPRAQQFLITEGTLQELSSRNAEYALALIHGHTLAFFHELPEWKARVATTMRAPANVYDLRRRAIYEMASTIKNTVMNSNGQVVERVVKNKELRFTDLELEQYLEALLDDQEGLCAISGIPLQYPGKVTDEQLLCSVDRIDSNGHYEAGNLQIVCRFINRWKSDSEDNEFRRLIRKIRGQID